MLNIFKNIEKRSVDDETLFLVRSGLYICLFAGISISFVTIANFLSGNINVAIMNVFITVICFIVVIRSLQNIYQPLLMSLGILPVTALAIYFAIGNVGLAGALWAFPSVLAIYATLKEKHAWMVNFFFAITILIALWQAVDFYTFIRFTLCLLATNIYVGVFKRQLSTHQRKLENAAVADELTGLLNRRLLNTELTKAKEYCNQNKNDVVMLLIDIDKFKNINDTFGHFVGDKVIKAVGEYLKSRFRNIDAIFRIGGEEFIVLLYDIDLINARGVSNAMLKDIQALTIHENLQVTVSVGIACYQEGEDVDEWMQRADEKMYLAKNNGRNQIAY